MTRYLTPLLALLLGACAVVPPEKPPETPTTPPDVVVVPTPFPRHQIVMLELTDRLHAFVRKHGGIVLVSPIDIVFNQMNVLQPDIVVFTAERRHHVHLDEAIRVAPDVPVAPAS